MVCQCDKIPPTFLHVLTPQIPMLDFFSQWVDEGEHCVRVFDRIHGTPGIPFKEREWPICLIYTLIIVGRD